MNITRCEAMDEAHRLGHSMAGEWLIAWPRGWDPQTSKGPPRDISCARCGRQMAHWLGDISGEALTQPCTLPPLTPPGEGSPRLLHGGRGLSRCVHSGWA